MPTYGLIGYPLSHSFSRGYFTEKFAAAGLAETHRYVNIEISSLNQFEKKLEEYSDLRGCNVTIPYKQAVIKYLDGLNPLAARIGAVNTIAFRDGQRIGYNTDIIGFRDDLLEQLEVQQHPLLQHEPRALILGTGGASLAVAAALQELGIPYTYVSRTAGPDRVLYEGVDADLLLAHPLLINTTPLGMSPRVDTSPPLPYAALTERHFCYDLVYNPAVTEFLKRSRAAGASTANGLGMLHKQAEASWQIWNRE